MVFKLRTLVAPETYLALVTHRVVEELISTVR